MAGDRIRYLRAKTLKSGTAYYWEPDDSLKAMGLVAEALGPDRDKAETRALALNQLAAEVRRTGRNPDAGPRPGTVGRLIADYRASDEWADLKPRTTKGYDRWLDRFADGFTAWGVQFEGVAAIPAYAITAKVLKVWVKAIRKAGGAYEAFHALGAMRALWAWAETEEWVDDSPARKVKNKRPPKRKQQWPLEFRARFLQAAFDLGHPGLGVAMLVADNISQSPIDIFSLTAADWDGAALRPRGRTKTGEGDDAVFALWDHVAYALTWYLSTRPALLPAAPLFVNDLTGRPWEESRRGKEFRKVRAAAGLPATVQFQDLRRTAATEAGDAGGTAFEVQTMLRHASASESATYVKTGATMFASVSEKRMKRRRDAD